MAAALETHAIISTDLNRVSTIISLYFKELEPACRSLISDLMTISIRLRRKQNLIARNTDGMPGETPMFDAEQRLSELQRGWGQLLRYFKELELPEPGVNQNNQPLPMAGSTFHNG